MNIINTKDPAFQPSVVMMVYGEGGVGKTTFASTGPDVLLADCENGSKYFGLRGIKVDIAQIRTWSDMKDFLDEVKKDKYKTIVIDPIGELMEKLKTFMIAKADSKLVQRDGSPTMAGWGWLKTTLKMYIKALRDTGKHIILVAHLTEKDDEGRMIKRPKIETKLADDLVALVDIVAYMTVVKTEAGDDKRVLIVDPTNDKYTAKDRTGQLGKLVEPDFSKIINACQGNKTYQWSNTEQIMKEEIKKSDEKDEKKEAVKVAKDKLKKSNGKNK